jgi:hypothetical protein
MDPVSFYQTVKRMEDLIQEVHTLAQQRLAPYEREANRAIQIATDQYSRTYRDDVEHCQALYGGNYRAEANDVYNRAVTTARYKYAKMYDAIMLECRAAERCIRAIMFKDPPAPPLNTWNV